METKTELKDLQNHIIDGINKATKEAVAGCCTAYNSPFQKIVHSVIVEHEPRLREIFNNQIDSVIKSKQFKEDVKDAFQHKLAKQLVATFNGSIDKSFNSMKSDPVIRAKSILAIQNIIDEFGIEKVTAS